MDATFAGGTDGTTGLAATAGDAEVTLSWTDPSNSDLDRYQYRQGTGTTVTWGSWTNIGSSSATTTSHTVTGLTNGTEYAFQVRAVDGAANGADGETVRATPRFDPPAGLTATAGTTQVTLSWTNPSDNTISGYQYRQGSGSPLAWGTWTEIVGSGATTTSATVTGLTNGTQYSFEVRAVNGAASPTVTATPVVAPDAPTGLLAVPGVGRVTLYWINPNNRDITGYQYQTRASGITYGIAIIAGSDASTTKGTAGSLGNGAAVDFRVRALAGAVEGAWSAWVSATPQSAVDATVQSLSPTSVSVVEGANAEMVVRLDRSVSADVQVYFSATDGTATKGADYPAGTLTGPEATTGLYRVTIPAGSTSATLSIATTDDTAYEGASAETFTVAITHIVSTAVIGEPTVKQFTVNLQDNDSAVVLSATSVTVAEPTGATTYTVRLPFQPSANVDVAVAPAVAGVVTVAPASLTFARNNWSTAQMVTVTAEDDDIDNAGGSRSVEIAHTPSSSDNRFQASRLRATVTDDDTRGYTFNPTALTMAEGGGGTYTVALNSQPTGNVTVTVTSSNADVTVDTDTGTDGNQNTLTFTTGDWETARTVTVSAAADADTTNDSATLTHTGVGADYGSISANTLTVTVTELATVDLSVSAASITEGAGPLTLTATRSEANDSGSPIVIPIRVKADGTTAEPADYTLAASISIASTESTGTATFAVANDNADEPPETVIVELGTLPAGNQAGDDSEVEITIIDNDATRVTLSGAAGAVTEGGAKEFTVTLNRGLVNGEALTVPLTFGGTATRGTDYTTACASATGAVCQDLNNVAVGNNPRVTFTGPDLGATATSVTLTLTALKDSLFETGQTVDIGLGALNASSGSGLGGGASGTDSLAPFSIEDDPAPTAELDMPGKINSTAAFTATVTFSEAVDGFVTGDINVTGGTKGAFTGSDGDTEYTLSVTPTSGSDVTVTVLADSATDGGSNTGPEDAVEATAEWDVTAPTLSIHGVPPTITDTTAFTVEFDFSEPVTGFETGDITVTGGAKGALTDGTDNYELSVTPTGDADVVITVPANAVTDGANTGPTGDVTATATWIPPGVTTAQPADRTVTEGDATNTATFTVALATEPSSAVTVTVTAPAGLILDGPDSSTAFSASEALTFATNAWSTAQTVTVRAIDDSTDSPRGRQLAVTYAATSSDGDYSGLTGTAATVTVVDDDATEVTLAGAAGNVEEGNTKEFTVTLNRGLVNGEALPVPLAFGGAATRGTDYTTACPTTLPDGVTCNDLNTATTPTVTFTGPGTGATATSVTLTLSATGDSMEEGSETVTIGLGALDANSGSGLGGGASGSGSLDFSITDPNRAPTVAKALPDRQAPVGQAFSYQFPADAFADADGDTLDYSADLSDGSALPTWLTFTEATRTFSGTPQSGNAGTLTVRVTAADGNGGTVQDTFTLVVAAAAATVSLGGSGDEYFEDAPSFAVDVNLSGALENNVDVYLDATGGTATEGADYAAGAETGPGGAAGLYKATIAAGATTATLTVALTDDAVLEGAETVTLAIVDIVGADVVGRGAPTTRTLTLIDGENGLTASTTRLEIRETLGGGRDDEATYTLRLPIAPTAVVTVAVAPETAGVATVVPTSLTFNAENWNIPQTVTVTAVDDDIVNPGGRKIAVVGHSLTSTDLRFDSASAPRIGVEVQDDDTAGLAFVPDELPVGEGATADYTVALTAKPTGNVTVTVASDAAAVTFDTDSGMPGVQTTPLTFTADTWDTPQTVTVAAAQDNDTMNDSATLTHTAAGGGYAGVTGNLGVTVTDDDSPLVTLAVSASSITEGGTALTLTATRSEANTSGAALEFPIRVKADGTTAASGDYTLATSINIPNNMSSGTATFTAADDSDDEPPETVVVELHTPPSGTELGATTEVEITIADNDATEVTLSGDAIEATEGRSGKSFTVSLGRGLEAGETLTVPLTIAGTATRGTDYTLSCDSATGVSCEDLNNTAMNNNPRVTFTGPDAGATAASVRLRVAAVDDGAWETNGETVDISPGTPAGTGLGGGVAAPADNLPVFRILDPYGLVFTPTALTVGEGATNTYTVTLSREPNLAVTVTVASDNSDVTFDTDSGMAGSQNTLGFTASDWATGKTVTVSAAQDDDTADDSATLTHTGSGTGSLYVGVTGDLMVTVNDDDADGVTVAETGGGTAVTEGGGDEDTFTVVLDTPPGGPAEVFAAAASGVELEGSDPNLDFSASERIGFSRQTGNPGGWDGPRTVRVRATAASENGTDTPGSRTAVEVTFTTNELGAGTAYDDLDVPALSVDVIDNDPTSVTLARTGGTGLVAEGGTATLTVTLGRDLIAGETVTAPLTVSGTGVTPGDYTLILASGGSLNNGVTILTSSPHSAAQPAVVFTGSDTGTQQVATLTLTAVADGADESNETLSVGFGSVTSNLDRADASTSGTGGTMPAGAPVAITIGTADTAAPTATLTDVPGRINDRAPFTATVTFNEPVTGFIAGDITVAGGAKGAFTPVSTTEYTLVVTPAGGGADVVVTVLADSATDGNSNTGPAAAVVETAVWDATAPTLDITGLPDKINDRTARTVTFTFSEAVTGFATGDVSVSGGAKGAFTGDDGDTEYTLLVTPAGSADVVVTVAANAATDGVNTGPASQQAETAEWDTTAPTLSITGLPGKINDRTARTVTFTFSEAVTGFATGDVSVSGGVKGAFTGDDGDTDYTLLVTPNDGADVVVTVAANAATDGVNTGPASQQAETAEWDATTPTLAISGLPERINDRTARTVTFTFSEAVTGFATGDVTVSGGVKGAFTGGDGDTEYTLSVTPNDGADVTVTVAANAATDGANTAPASQQSETAEWDATAPTLEISGLPASIDSTAALTATFTFSEAVTGFAADDITVAGGTAGAFASTSATVYTLMVTPAGSADVVVTVRADAATDGLNTGPASAEEATAAWEPPAAPTGLTATPGNARVFLNWTNPSDSDIDKYQVRQGTGTTVTWGEWTDIGSSTATTTIHTVTGLANGTEYSFQIRAVDGTAESTESNTAVATPAAALVFTPASLNVNEGMDRTYTVALASRPTGGVTVTVASDNADVTFDTNSGSPGNQSTLSFSTTTWGTAQTVTVAAAQDDDTTNDTATLSHSASGGGYGSVTGDLAVTVTDDDSPSVTLSASAASITEGGTTLTLTATRSAANTSGGALAFPVQVKTADTTAQPADYTLGAATISIANNASSGTTTFAVADDNADEPPETVVIELGTPPAGTVLGATTEVEITIADNDATTVTLAGAAGNVEEGGTKTFTVTLGRGLAGGEILPVPLTFGGGATRGTDYTTTCATATGVACQDLNSVAQGSNPRVTFTGPSANAVTLTLSATADNAAETGDETVDIDLGTLNASSGTNLGGGASGTDTLATFSIADPIPDAPAAPTGLTATAGDGQVALAWADPGDSDIDGYEYRRGSGSPFAWGGWTAIAGSTAATVSHTVTGLVNGTQYSFQIRALDGTVASAESNTATATPMGPVTLTIDPAALTVDEGGDTHAVLKLKLSAARATDTAVTVLTVGGTASENSDFTPGPHRVTILAGDREATLRITILDDDFDENDEAFTVLINTGSLPTGVTAGAPGQATVTIRDDDAPPPAPAGLTAEAGDGRVVLAWAYAPPAVDRTSGFEYRVRAGSAAWGAWTAVPGGAGRRGHTVTGLVNGTAHTFEVRARTRNGLTGPASAQATATPDSAASVLAAEVRTWISEPSCDPACQGRWRRALKALGGSGTDLDNVTPLTHREALTLVYTDTARSARWGRVATALRDLEAERVRVSIAALTAGPVAEGAVLTFRLTASEAPAADLAVSVVVEDVQASPGAQRASDFVAEAMRTVTIQSGQTTAEFTVQTVDDGAAEPGGFVNATLEGSLDYAPGARWGASVEVADNDAPDTVRRPVATVSGGAGVTEGAGAVFTLQVAPPPSTSLAVSVDITQDGDFAASGQIGARTVTVGAGGTATFTVATEDDGTDEADGAVRATLTAGVGYAMGTPATASVVVADNDAAPPSTIFVPDAALVADIRQWRGETQHGQAHVDRWTRVLIALGVETGSLAPMPSSEAQGYADRGWTRWVAVVAELKRKEAHDAQPVTPVTPPTLPTVTVSGNGAVTEGTGASFTVSRAGDTAAALTVLLAVSEDTSGGRDFVAADDEGNQQVVIQAGSATATFTVPTTADSVDEPDGQVTVALRTSSAYTLGTPSSGTVAVSDDDGATPPPTPILPTVTVSGDSAVTEGTGAAFMVSRTGDTGAALTVLLEVSEDTSGGRDFVDTNDEGNQQVVIQAGSATATYTVPTSGDSVDEPDGTVTLALRTSGDYTSGSPSSATVAVGDDDATTVTLSGPSGDIAEAGGAKTFTVTLGRAPVAGEWVRVPLMLGGTATRSADWTAECADAPGVRCRGLDSFDRPFIDFIFAAGEGASATATVTLTAVADTVDEGAGETVTVALGTLETNASGGATGTGTLGFTISDDDDPLPAVSVAAGANVTEGTDATFTLTVSPAPAAALTVNYTVADADGADFLLRANEGAKALEIPAGQTSASVTVPTVADSTDEPDGEVTLTLAAGAGYRLGTASATVTVADDDATTGPTLSISDAQVSEGGNMPFTITLSAPSRERVCFDARTRDSTPRSATAGTDYTPNRWNASRYLPCFRPGHTTLRLWIKTWNDAHDDPDETFEMVLSNPRGATIADAVAVGMITNDDPLPAAFLARFGRTVAEQALGGIAGRMAAGRTPGLEATIAGHAPNFDPHGGAAPGQPAAGLAGTSAMGATGGGVGPAMVALARGFGAQASGPATGSGRASDPSDKRFGLDTSAPRSSTMSEREALLGSRFSLTGERDDSGGTMAFWGRASEGRFDGAERGNGSDITLDGTVTTAMLGADYARGDWLLGVALLQSTADGEYASSGDNPCPAVDGEAQALCDGAVRAGDGKVEAQLTAAVPYAAVQASERLELWGALGYGTGEVTLKTAMGGNYRADTDWTMAAAGLRGDVLAPLAESGGPALALVSDALWARTTSDRTRDLAASDSDVTRLRLGLEGSWRVALDGSGALVPRLEIGARHDGGDAETGFGIELGAGIGWTHPTLGLSLDLSGRTLVAHEDDDLEDRGYAAAFTFDPAPATERGPSLSLRQDFGGRARGGLDALFASGPLEERTGRREAQSRWAMEAAYGFSALGGRFTASPHTGLGLTTGERDYSLGWRLTPEASSAPHLSFELAATRRESDAAAPEHGVGIELVIRW